VRPSVLFVGRTRYRLPLEPALSRKWDALGDAMDGHFLARAVERECVCSDPRFRLARPVRPRAVDGIAFYASLPFRIGRELRREDPQAVFAQSPYEAAAALVARRAVGNRARVILELHGDWRTATRLYGSPLRRLLEPLTEPIARAAVRRADVVRTISGYTTGLVRSLGREPGGEFPAYVDLAAFLARPPAPLPQAKVVLFVGVLERYKGIDLLAAAWRRLADRVPDAQLRIVGEGPEAPLLRGLSGRVQWERRLSQEEVVGALDSAALLVLPSRSEGLPRVVIEAFCRGRAVVGAKAGGIPDIVEHGVSGLLVPPEAPQALADALARCLEDRPLLERLGAGARASVTPWLQTPEEFAQRTLALVERATQA
jgi:glycosyltransferase involved in cell wall biosynthesis